MPTFTRIALETLLEPGVRGGSKNSLHLKQDTCMNGGNKEKDKSDGKKKKKKIKHKKAEPPKHIFISPALYATPEPKPIPDSCADCVSPSPYVVNRKRRDFFRLPLPQREEEEEEAIRNRIDGFEFRRPQKFSSAVEEDIHRTESFALEGDGGVESDSAHDFLDPPPPPPRDAMSISSSSEVVDDFDKSMSNQGIEFYDADEEFSSDGSISNVASSHRPNIEFELHVARVNLLDEIERRKSTQVVLNQMYSQWQRIGSLLSQAGLTFPMPLHTSSSMQLEIDSIEQFSQELLVVRFVSEAMGKAEARAEAEIAAETIIGSKDQEISRLRDRMQYYEAVNHEMCHRNQEVIGMARRQRQRKRSQRRWIWGCIGLSIAIGASIIAYPYLPQTIKHPLVISSENCTTASTSSSQSSEAVIHG